MLTENKTIVESPISKDEYFMRQVYLTAMRSKDFRTRIGAILVKDGDICSSGFNGFARGVVDYSERYTNREFKNRAVCHAEANTILNAARKGIATLGTTLFTLGVPCKNCMNTIIQAGISEVVIHKQWPNLNHVKEWTESIKLSEMLAQEAGVKIRVFDKFLNVVGRLDDQDVIV